MILSFGTLKVKLYKAWHLIEVTVARHAPKNTAEPKDTQTTSTAQTTARDELLSLPCRERKLDLLGHFIKRVRLIWI